MRTARRSDQQQRIRLSFRGALILCVFLLGSRGLNPATAQTATLVIPISTADATVPPDATPDAVLSGAQLKAGMLVQYTLRGTGTGARFVIIGAYGDLLSIGVFPSDEQPVAPTLELDAPDGTVLGSSAGTAGGVSGALIPAVTLPQTGAYELYVQANDPRAVGVYTLRLANDWILRDLGSGTIKPEALTVGRINQAADRQSWQVNLTAGTQFTVVAQSAGDGTLDPVIDVQTPPGTRLGVAHDSSDARKAVTDVLTAPVTGLYSIRISAYVDASTGPYDLVVHLVTGS